MANDEPGRLSVYRFGDRLALWSGSGNTVYIELKDVRKLAKAINLGKRDLERSSFLDSQFGTETIDVMVTQ